MTTRAEVLELASEAEAILPSVAVVLREYADLLNGGNIVDRPKEAIERVRQQLATTSGWGRDAHAVLSYLDWLEGKHVVEWPKECTGQEMLAWANDLDRYQPNMDITKYIRALAAIAPERKKRVVSIWEEKGANGHPNNIAYHVLSVDAERTSNDHHYMGWRKVAGPIELED